MYKEISPVRTRIIDTKYLARILRHGDKEPLRCLNITENY